MDKRSNNQALTSIAILIPMAAFVIGVFAIPLDQNFLINPTVMNPWWYPAIWYGSSAITFFMMYKSDTLVPNVIGTVICIILGPITLIAFCLLSVFNKMGVWK